MTNLLTKYRDWQSGIKSRRLAKWPRLRQKGKFRYVAETVLIMSLAMNGLTAVVVFAFHRPQDIEFLTFMIVWFFLFGLWVGHKNWNECEKEFLSNSEPPISRAEIAAIK